MKSTDEWQIREDQRKFIEEHGDEIQREQARQVLGAQLKEMLGSVGVTPLQAETYRKAQELGKMLIPTYPDAMRDKAEDQWMMQASFMSGVLGYPLPIIPPSFKALTQIGIGLDPGLLTPQADWVPDSKICHFCKWNGKCEIQVEIIANAQLEPEKQTCSVFEVAP